jgi:hypothetical protein
VLLLHQKGKLQQKIGGEKISKAEALAVRQRVNERKWKLQMQKNLAAEGSIVHVHDYQQVVEEFSVF